VIHLLGSDVFHFQECAQDKLALAGELQAMFGEMLFENFNFFDSFGHHLPPRKIRVVLNLKEARWSRSDLAALTGLVEQD
jgi:hypothetical protein